MVVDLLCTWPEPMRIEDAYWQGDVNHLLIRCGCGERIDQRADRWLVRCPACGHKNNLSEIRERYVQEHYQAEPKITVSTLAVEEATHQVVTTQSQMDTKDIPRSVMDEITQLAGNGQAKVTVSADFGIKDYGTGASAMCSVSLTCNQDTKSIERAAQIAGELARDIAQEQRQRAEQDLNTLLTQRGGGQSGAPRYGG
jgi:predicted ATP-dependent serine protease